MNAGPHRTRWQVVGVAKQAATSYRANREDLEPVIRLAADVLALIALIRRRQAPPPGECAAKGTCG